MKQITAVSKMLKRATFQIVLVAAIAVPVATLLECLIFTLTQLNSTVSTATISALTTLVINCVLSIIFPRWMRWPSQLKAGAQKLGNPETYHRGGDRQENEVDR